MAMDVQVGPFISVGNAIYPTTATGLPVGTEELDLEAGPNLQYQGDAILDPRFYLQKDYAAGKQGVIPSHLNSPVVLGVDTNPAASVAALNNIVAAANTVGGTPMTFAAASAGITTGVPFYPFKANTVLTAPIALDFGFLGVAANAAVDTLSLNGTATATASSLLCASNFYPGQWLVIPNAGASATTTLITQVTAVSGTSITLNPAPGQTITAAACGSCNIPNVNGPIGPTGLPAVPTAAWPYLAGGVAAIMNPKECLSRGVGIVASAGGVGVLTIQGYDIYGQFQSQALTANSTTPVYSTKTWKYITAVIPTTTDGTHTYAVGTSDLFGFSIRSDRYEYTDIFWNGAFVTTQATLSTGVWTGADLTNPATATTGDVRGTFQAGSRGPTASVTSPSANAVLRLAMFVTIPLYNVISATPANPAPLYGNFPV
jgi:hypothetical protein